MAGRGYPSTFEEITPWSQENQASISEARTRFVEYVILKCIASNARTRNGLVLKGGNALRFAYQSPRSTKDLDFTAERGGVADNQETIRQLLDSVLKLSERRFNVKTKCQRVKRNPKSFDATRPTYDIGIGYAFPGDRLFNSFNQKNVTTVIPVEITLNDLICDSIELVEIDGLRVCTVEDIVAEKLRSLLQQKTRNRNRWQDVYDIAVCRSTTGLDLGKITKYFTDKSVIREIEVRKSSFDEEVRERAEEGYQDQMQTEAPRDLIPFDDAWDQVIKLVNSLNIAD